MWSITAPSPTIVYPRNLCISSLAFITSIIFGLLKNNNKHLLSAVPNVLCELHFYSTQMRYVLFIIIYFTYEETEVQNGTSMVHNLPTIT